MATPRTFWRAVLDRCMAWILGLPSETSGYSVTPIQIPLRDGCTLAGDLYTPTFSDTSSTKPAGLLLVHGPYGRGWHAAVVDASIWAARGYQVLLVCCRGVWVSTGYFDAGRAVAADAQVI